jgi:hypothetical protein
MCLSQRGTTVWGQCGDWSCIQAKLAHKIKKDKNQNQNYSSREEEDYEPNLI